MFYDDPNVLYVSLHRWEQGDFYPGTGDPSRVGEGAGRGYNCNIGWCGLPAPGDVEYAAAFDELIMPLARAFDPELVLVSAGFDAALGDPLGECEVTPAGYAHMTHRLCELAQGRVVVALEGGYNLTSISRSSEAVLRVLLGHSPPSIVRVPARVHERPSVAAQSLGLVDKQAQLYDLQMQKSARSAAEEAEAKANDGETTVREKDESEEDEMFKDLCRDEALSLVAPASSALTAVAATLLHLAPFWPALQVKLDATKKAERLLRSHRDESGGDLEEEEHRDDAEEDRGLDENQRAKLQSGFLAFMAGKGRQPEGWEGGEEEEEDIDEDEEDNDIGEYAKRARVDQ
jgi:hypothetical protein